MRSGWLDVLFIVCMLLIVLMCIITLFSAVHEDEVRHDKCVMAGGIPVAGYCVKPNSFIEVK